jgi:hypothetical protein
MQTHGEDLLAIVWCSIAQNWIKDTTEQFPDLNPGDKRISSIFGIRLYRKWGPVGVLSF